MFVHKYGSFTIAIFYILNILSVDCQQAVNSSQNWVGTDALADEDGHQAPNTTFNSSTIIIDLTNYNAIRPFHHINNTANSTERLEQEKEALQNSDVGELLASDASPTIQDSNSTTVDLFINQQTPEAPLQDVNEAPPQQDEPQTQADEEEVVVMYTCRDPLDYEFVEGIPRSYIFNELSKEEILSLGDYISSQGYWWQGNESITVDHDTIPLPNVTDMLVTLQLYPPYKKLAIPYLDGETDTPPPRYAKAVIVRGSQRDIMEYKIGPLPLRNGNIIWEELTYPGAIPYAKRPQSGIGTAWMQYVIGRTAFDLRDIFRHITGGYCYGLTYWAYEGGMDWQNSKDECGEEDQWKIDWLSYPMAPASKDDKQVDRITRIHWYFFPANETYEYSHGDEGELHPIPLSFTINETEPDFKAWTAYDFEYCGQYFKSKEQLLEQFNGNVIYKCGAPEWGQDDYDWSWSSTYIEDRWRHRKPRTPSQDQAGPRIYEPEGHRFLIVGNDTAEGRRFAWMGWEGHITMRPDTGLAFYDIRFNETRILYELSLQDQYVAYSGFTGAGQVVYFDSNFGMGMTTNALRHGIDCPETAIYFTQTKLYSNGAVWADVDVICMFEVDMGETEWRHTHAGATKLVGIRRTELVVRSISTIGNYDYIYDIRFKLDASIDVQIHMAGYMEALFFDPLFYTARDMPFGTRVGKYSLANIHDHLSGWKVDFDIKGVNNSFQQQVVRYGTYEEAFSKYKELEGHTEPPGWFKQMKLKYIDMETIEKEIGLQINSSEPTVWHIMNEASTNSFGEPNGYIIMHKDTHMQLLDNDHPFLVGAAWTKYHLAVTKYKDVEYVSHASTYDTYLPHMPVRSLDHYINDENIVGEDLVAWVMVGVVHVPRTEDVPLISNLGIGFQLKPWNYFDELVSMSVMEKTNFSLGCIPLSGAYFDYMWAMEK